MNLLRGEYRSIRRFASDRIPSAFHDSSRSPAEWLVQGIWQHQRIRRGSMRTWDGRPVTILHPGFLNLEPGPDFRRAIIQIGDAAPLDGDIEIDLSINGWHDHGHDRNKAFEKVILHVVWNAPRHRIHDMPILHLEPLVDAPIEALVEWLPSSGSPQSVLGKCCVPFASIDTGQINGILEEAAVVRLESKARQLVARSNDATLASGLLLGLFAALGYKNNSWPMLRLGELAPDLGADTLRETQARLLGVSGLLPRDLPDHCMSTREYVRDVWHCWWRENESFHNQILPLSTWNFAGIRPANHPLRRLALAGHWLQKKNNLFEQIKEWGISPMKPPVAEARLLKILSPVPEGNDYWQCHWNFTSQPMKKSQPLLGRQRLNDIVVNVILPWLFAREPNDVEARKRVVKRFLEWPAGQSNARLKSARTRMFGEEVRKLKPTAAIQQGLLQIEQDFCSRSNALCDDCRFPGFLGFERGTKRGVPQA